LSRKSFEKIKSGLSLTPSDQTTTGSQKHKNVTYELSYVHKKKLLTIKIKVYALFASVFNILVKGSAVSKNVFAAGKKASTIGPAKVELRKQEYSVVNVSDLELHGAGLVAGSEVEAYAMQDSLVQRNPSLKGKIQVVSNFELN